MSENSVKIISVSNAIKDFSMADNTDTWQMLYLHSGALTVTLNNSVYLLSPDNLLLISPKDFYYIDENNTAIHSTVQFKSSNLYDFGSSGKIFELNSSLIELVKALLSEYDPIQRKLMLQLLLNHCSKLNPNAPLLKTEKTRVFSKAVSIMERYIASTVTVDDFAQMLRVSLSGLKRIFWKYTGTGVHEYYLMLKINKAKELLLSGYSITRTAKVLQFSSQPYFSTTFKRVTGISAKAFSKGNFAVTENRKNRTIESSKRRTVTHQTHIRQIQQPTATQPASTPAPTTRRSDLPDYLL